MGEQLAPTGRNLERRKVSKMNIDNIPEYQQMRRGLFALRLEVAPLIADDLLMLCEKAIRAVRDIAYQECEDDRIDAESAREAL